jgi:hypothetical protein
MVFGPLDRRAALAMTGLWLAMTALWTEGYAT